MLNGPLSTDRTASHLWLTTWTGNSRAVAFNLAMGFEDFGTTQYVCEGVAYENHVLAKRLGNPLRVTLDQTQ